MHHRYHHYNRYTHPNPYNRNHPPSRYNPYNPYRSHGPPRERPHRITGITGTTGPHIISITIGYSSYCAGYPAWHGGTGFAGYPGCRGCSWNSGRPVAAVGGAGRGRVRRHGVMGIMRVVPIVGVRCPSPVIRAAGVVPDSRISPAPPDTGSVGNMPVCPDLRVVPVIRPARPPPAPPDRVRL